MKRLLFIMVCLFAVTFIASAQKIVTPPHYAETYDERTNKLESKQWVSTDKYRQELPGTQGASPKIAIFRQDSAKFFILDPEKKTYITFSMDQLTNQTIIGLEAMETANRSIKREFKGKELVEGCMCDHYNYVTTLVMKGGMEESSVYDHWICPQNNMVLRTTVGVYMDEPKVTRNIKMGPQPDYLFEIPTDFKVIAVPMGGMLEMFTGKSKEDNQQMLDEVNKKAEDLKEQLEKINKIENKDEQLQEVFKMLNQSIKKK